MIQYSGVCASVRVCTVTTMAKRILGTYWFRVHDNDNLKYSEKRKSVAKFFGKNTKVKLSFNL